MSDSNAPVPAAELFSTLPLSNELQQVVVELGYLAMTEVQARTIPLLLNGQDVIAESKTGSGKTAAFALAILQKLNLDKASPQALVLCPTRELCAQVSREIRKLGRKHPGLHVLPVAGGTPSRPQKEALKKGVHIVVGTPGRVMDHLARGTLDLNAVRTVVLDEADRMLDMGFQQDVETILAQAPKKRQTAFFSATFPSPIATLSQKYQKDAQRVTIKDTAESRPAIRQFIYEAHADAKGAALAWIIQKHRPDSAIVFCNLKASVKEIVENLANKGISTAALHGDLEQMDRDRVMAKLRGRSIRVLVATDVAARGIDIEGLDLVVNFDLPSQPEIYVHRIGRTGRAGKAGMAVSLVSARELHKVRLVEEFTGVVLDRKPVGGSDASEKTPSTKAVTKEAAMTTLQIAGGRKDKLRPGDILGALTGEAGGLKGEQIGKIEIHDRHTYVAVAKGIAKDALKSLQDGRIKGRKFKVEFL